jgi:HSP20 family molecular chaperone IbpA
MSDQSNPEAGRSSAEGSTSQMPSTMPRADADGQLPTYIPPTDIFETKDSVIMLLEMPGVEPSTLDVVLDKRVLTVSAQSTPQMPKGYTLLYSEYQDGNYERAFTLSDQIDGDHIDAEFKDGILRLVLPKMNPPAKKIEVKAA